RAFALLMTSPVRDEPALSVNVRRPVRVPRAGTARGLAGAAGVGRPAVCPAAGAGGSWAGGAPAAGPPSTRTGPGGEDRPGCGPARRTARAAGGPARHAVRPGRSAPTRVR